MTNEFYAHEKDTSLLLGGDSVKGADRSPFRIRSGEAAGTAAFTERAARSEQSKLKRRISSLQFAAWELHLYLDSHPHCAEAAKKLSEYRELAKKLHAEYEDKYGPLNETARETSRWAWISDPWPWEAEANE